MTKITFITGMMLLTFSIVACSGGDEGQNFNPQPDPPGATAPRGTDDSDASARRPFNPQPDPPGATEDTSK